MKTSPAISRRYKRTPARARRGVLLLMVLSLLVLFVLLGMTFIMTASQFNRASSMRARADLYGDSPQRLTEIAINQMLRGTAEPGSAIYGHGLLRDLYGSDGMTAKVVGPPQLTLGGQQLVLQGTDLSRPSGVPAYSAEPLTTLYRTSFYNGGVLTFTSGEAAGQSARIMRYTVVDTDQVQFAIETEGSLATTTITASDRFVVNGRPLNGVGFGYDPTSGNLTKVNTDDGRLAALLPNLSMRRFEELERGETDPNGSDTLLGLLGGSDEAYDIADYQNMLTAWVPADPIRKQAGHIIPSLHRPALINYWLNQSGDGTYPAEASLRPSLEHHPNFAGRPTFDPVNGPWDIDNDGDGFPDSVYTDLGVPPFVNAQGKLVKPMFAILCVDGEGRVDLNAAGTLTQTADDSVSFRVGGDDFKVARGEGYGPAEIRLSTVAENPDWIMRARYNNGTETNPVPGAEAFNDDLVKAPFKHLLAASEYNPANVSPYLNPIDFTGRSVWKLDPFGQPVLAGVAVLGQAGAYVDDPYESSISTPNGDDFLFGAADWESQLRKYDADQFDISRRLDGGGIVDPGLVTTLSFEVPAPPSAPPLELRPAGMQRSFLDLVNARYGFDPTNQSYAAQMQTMFPYELLRGQKLNLNRLLGLSADNNGNGVADEPSEIGGANGPDILNDNGAFLDVTSQPPRGPANPAPFRQMMARHLYCLARTFVAPNAQMDFDGDGMTSVLETNFALAQWAVNIVDFRDADSIMTPFEFDVDLSNGWGVDGNLVSTNDPDRGIVWGCERPELLISETLAWHDRRTEQTDTGGNEDPHFDQRYRPQSGFFLEVFNPWSSAIDRKPRELYDETGAFVPLNRFIDGPAGQSPVWRFMITEEVERDPDDPSYRDVGGRFGEPDRMVYLTERERLHSELKVGDYFGMSEAKAAAAGRVLPGGYAVIGSSGEQDENTGRHVSACSILQGQSPDSNMEATRRIELSPTGRQNFSPLREPNADEQPVFPVFGTAIVDLPKSLTISEPVGGDYDSFDPADGISDIPLDLDPDSPLAEHKNGCQRSFRIVHLQRLADPTLPFHPDQNPYRTIDSSFVDLNVYNSADTDEDPGLQGAEGDTSFHAVQRGDGWRGRDWHWLYRMQDSGATPAHDVDGAGDGDMALNYDKQLRTTLGQLNTEYLALNGRPAGIDGTNVFPWLNWNNRPYVSEYELLNVPRTSSYRLVRDFGNFAVRTPTGPQRFPHLFDLFSGNPLQGGGIGLDRILDYVDVPSRFMGSEKWYSTDAFSSQAGDPNAATFRTGHNYMSRMREPGKVNLNTIVDGRVWQALAAAMPNMYAGVEASTFWSSYIERSIRVPGFSPDTPGSHLNAEIPTQFPRPFRPTAISDLGPTPEMREPDLNGRPLGRSGLLRENPILSGVPMFSAWNNTPDEDPQRNPYFFHRGIQRLANMTTTQSNVYAVWVTVAYFEVEPAGVTNAIYPDGYRYGVEAGADTGQVERHRSFFILDRSIPVGFEPGKNHNVDKAILLRRHLE